MKIIDLNVRIEYDPVKDEIVNYTTTLNGVAEKKTSTTKKTTNTQKRNNSNYYVDMNSSSRRISGRTYATGVKKLDEDQLAWTQEDGSELIISPSAKAVLTPLSMGDTVFTADMTNNLWDWAKINPAKMQMNSSMPNLGNVSMKTVAQSVTQQITVTLPNITNEAGFNNFAKEMNRLKLSAYQFASKN